MVDHPPRNLTCRGNLAWPARLPGRVAMLCGAASCPSVDADADERADADDRIPEPDASASVVQSGPHPPDRHPPHESGAHVDPDPEPDTVPDSCSDPDAYPLRTPDRRCRT